MPCHIFHKIMIWTSNKLCWASQTSLSIIAHVPLTVRPGHPASASFFSVAILFAVAMLRGTSHTVYSTVRGLLPAGVRLQHRAVLRPPLRGCEEGLLWEAVSGTHTHRHFFHSIFVIDQIGLPGNNRHASLKINKLPFPHRFRCSHW